MFKTISEPVLERMDNQFQAFKESIDTKFDQQKESMDAQKESMDAKFDQQKESMDAQKESMDAQLSNLRWVIGIGIGVLIAAGVFNVLANFFNWGVN